MLCLATGPSSMTTEIPISCTPPHLLQETTIPYRICELFAVDVTAFLAKVSSCIQEIPSSFRSNAGCSPVVLVSPPFYHSVSDVYPINRHIAFIPPAGLTLSFTQQRLCFSGWR